MLVYNSMIVWIAILGVSYIWLRQYNQKQGINKASWDKVPMIYAILTFGYIIFWAGIRSGVADTATYIAGFESYPVGLDSIWKYWDSDRKAPGYDILVVLFKTYISTDYHDWFMTIAVASGVPIMLTLRKKSINFFYSAFLFIVTLNFTWMFNGIRQFFVVAVLFGITDWILERKTFKFIVVVLLLSTIHYTALVMIPIYWFVTGKPFGKKILCFIVALLICVIFIEPFVKTLESALTDTAYEGFTEQFLEDDGVNPIRVLVMMVPPLIAFICRKRVASINDKHINLCINMSLVSAGLYFLGVFTSGILIGRLPIYFELYNLILIPYLFKKCFTRDSAKILFVLCTLGFLAFYYVLSGNLYYVSDLTGVLL